MPRRRSEQKAPGFWYVHSECRPRDGKNGPPSPLLHHPYRLHRCTPPELALAHHSGDWRKLRLMPAASMLDIQSISLSGPISAECRLAGRSHVCTTSALGEVVTLMVESWSNHGCYRPSCRFFSFLSFNRLF